MRRPLQRQKFPERATAERAGLEAVDVAGHPILGARAADVLGEVEFPAVAAPDRNGRPSACLLPEACIASHTCAPDAALIRGNTRRNPRLCAHVTDHVDYAGQRVRTVQYGARAAHDLDTLNIS